MPFYGRILLLILSAKCFTLCSFEKLTLFLFVAMHSVNRNAKDKDFRHYKKKKIHDRRPLIFFFVCKDAHRCIATCDCVKNRAVKSVKLKKKEAKSFTSKRC